MTNPSESELCRPHDPVEAAGIEGLLRDNGIACELVPLGLRPYPTADNLAAPWGIVRVPPEDLERARVLLSEWQSGVREDLDTAWHATATQSADEPAPRSFSWGLLVLALIVAALLAGIFGVPSADIQPATPLHNR